MNPPPGAAIDYYLAGEPADELKLEITDAKGTILSVNAKFCEIAGHGRHDLLALDFMHITHPDDLPAELADEYRFTQGQHVALRATLNGEEMRRSYSVCSGCDDGELRVAVLDAVAAGEGGSVLAVTAADHAHHEVGVAVDKRVDRCRRGRAGRRRDCPSATAGRAAAPCRATTAGRSSPTASGPRIRPRPAAPAARPALAPPGRN
mgnify:CR=1 FL=1